MGVRLVDFRCPVNSNQQTATMPGQGEAGTLPALNNFSEPTLRPRVWSGEQSWSTAKAAGKVGFLCSINQDQRASAKALRAKQDAIRAHDRNSLAARNVLSKWVEVYRDQ